VEKNKVKISSGSTSSFSGITADSPIVSSESQMTLQKILEFCWRINCEEFVLAAPVSFDCKNSFSLAERTSAAKELLPTTGYSPLMSLSMTEHY
jgi:hypothetical protein